MLSIIKCCVTNVFTSTYGDFIDRKKVPFFSAPSPAPKTCAATTAGDSVRDAGPHYDFLITCAILTGAFNAYGYKSLCLISSELSGSRLSLNAVLGCCIAAAFRVVRRSENVPIIAPIILYGRYSVILCLRGKYMRLRIQNAK